MDREQLRRRVDSRWQEFSAASKGLSAKTLELPGAAGDWSVHDLKSHVATWEQESLSALRLIERGKRLPRYARFGGIDAFNLMKWEELRSMSPEEVETRFVRTHEELLTYLEGVPEQLYARETRFRRRLRLDSYDHLPEHTSQIIAWREAEGL